MLRQSRFLPQFIPLPPPLRAPGTEFFHAARASRTDYLGPPALKQWSKSVSSYTSDPESVTAVFEDGTSARGCLLVACDGGSSRIRRALFPEVERYKLPVLTMGLRADFSPREMRSIRAMDPFFLQAAASENDTFMYFSGEFLFFSFSFFSFFSLLPSYLFKIPVTFGPLGICAALGKQGSNPWWARQWPIRVIP